VLACHALEKIGIPGRSSLFSCICHSVLNVIGELALKPASIMEVFVMAEYPNLRVNSIQDRVERKKPVRHPFVMKVIELEAGLKN